MYGELSTKFDRNKLEVKNNLNNMINCNIIFFRTKFQKN